jgi:thiol:disulfide interchange protein
MEKVSKVIKLGATWCGPCKVYAKTFKAVSDSDTFNDVEFKSLDVEADAEGVELAEKHGVRGVPTTLIIDKDGNLITSLVGNMNESALKKAIEDADKQA